MKVTNIKRVVIESGADFVKDINRPESVLPKHLDIEIGSDSISFKNKPGDTMISCNQSTQFVLREILEELGYTGVTVVGNPLR